MKTIKIKGYKVTITKKETGSNYNHAVKVFAANSKMPICGTFLKNETECKEWAKLKIDEDLNNDMGEMGNFMEAENCLFNVK